MAIIHDEHGHVVDHKKTATLATKNMAKGSDAGSKSSGHNPGGHLSGGGRNRTSDRDRTKASNGSTLDSSGTGNQ
jgi:hypothetical protein